MLSSGILPYDIGTITYVWKIRVHLHEGIEADVLQDAVAAAATRYPYFLRRLVRQGESYVFQDNDLPLQIYDNTRELRSLNHESNNYHLLSVGYSGMSIDFAISHMLAGACGLVEWVRTVLYLYLSKKHGVELHVDGIKLPGEAVPETERLFISRELVEAAADGSELDIDEVPDSQNGTAPIIDYLVGLTFPKLTHKVYYRFELPQQEFMQKARSLEATPASLLSALMFKALFKVWPYRLSSIQAMIAHNYRAEVGLPETLCDLVRYIHVRYADSLVDAPLEKICTVTRGQILLQSDKAFAMRDGMRVVERIEAVEAQKTIEDKKRYCRKHDLYGERVLDSYQVSYVGRTEWGDMLPYIAAADIVTEGHLMLEVVSVGDRFYATLQQEVEKETYKDAFVEVLEAEGIAYSVSEAIDKRLPGFAVPK